MENYILRNLFLSQNPCKQNDYKRWFKSIKTTDKIGGEIVANAYGKTKEDAEAMARSIKAIPQMIEVLNISRTKLLHAGQLGLVNKIDEILQSI